MKTLTLRLRSFSLCFALLGVSQSFVGLARADANPADKAAAETLFDEARALMKEGNNEAACPKLADSQRLDPGIGTLLYLASCYEKTGRLASAWVTFREAAGAAHLAGQLEREKMATTRANALQPSLPKLTIEPNVDDGDPEIFRDGQAVARPLWRTAIPVDPGAHTIEARLAGHLPRSVTVTVAKGESLTVPIALLERDGAGNVASAAHEPTPAPAAEPMAEPSGASPVRRALPYAVGGVGAVALVVGGIFGLRAFSLASDVDDACPTGPCSSDVRAKADDSKAMGNLSTAFVAVGVVGLAAGVILWVTTPRGAVHSRNVTAGAGGLTVGF